MYQKIIACRAEGLANEIKELQGQLADYNTVKIENKKWEQKFSWIPNLQACILIFFESFIFCIVIYSHECPLSLSFLFFAYLKSHYCYYYV